MDPYTIRINLQILAAIMERPSSSSLQPVVLFGALLGIIRENDLLKWNNDIELGVAESNWNETEIQLLISDLRAAGYIVTYYRLCKAISIRGPDGVGEVHINYFQNHTDGMVRPLYKTSGYDHLVNMWSNLQPKTNTENGIL